MDLDRDLLLTAEHLRLESDLVKGQSDRGTIAFKRVASQTYLVVDALQAQVLQEFAHPRNVPAVLEACLRQRVCPPLREFYDLIVKAHRAGILRSEEIEAEGPASSSRLPVVWSVSLPPRLPLALSIAAGLAILVMGVLYPPALPPNWLAVLEGWGAACAALSLGSVIAASVLRDAGGEVHRPHLSLLSLTPHFAIDLKETCMVSRSARVTIFASTLLPLALLSAAALWQHWSWASVPLAVLFFALRPAGGGVVEKLLLLARRRPVIDTDGPPLFDAWVSLGEEWRHAWRRLDLRLTALQLGLGIAWTIALGAEAYRLWGMPLGKVWEHRAEWRTESLALVAVIIGIPLLWGFWKVQYRVVDRCLMTGKRWRDSLRRWRGKAANIDPLQLETMVRRNALLGRLDRETQLELIECLRPLEVRPWRKVIAFDAEPEFVGLVLSGRASLSRRHKAGRRVRFLRIIEGDLFGAHKLFDPVDGNLEVRADSPFVAATLARADFQRLVIDRLGMPAVGRYLQNHLFLQRASALSADWRPAAVARFAELATIATHPAREKILVQGQEVGNLYVLYEGQACAMRDRKAVGKFKQGDFFGEVALLQTSGATTDVESKEDTRCLVVHRVEFIRFMSRNHHVALQLERMCSRRLGHPIFPLNQQSFDVR